MRDNVLRLNGAVNAEVSRKPALRRERAQGVLTRLLAPVARLGADTAAVGK
jgi:hypothetical protein